MTFRLTELPSEVKFAVGKIIHINSQCDKQEIVNIINSLEKIANYPTKKRKRKAQ